ALGIRHARRDPLSRGSRLEALPARSPAAAPAASREISRRAWHRARRLPGLRTARAEYGFRARRLQAHPNAAARADHLRRAHRPHAAAHAHAALWRARPAARGRRRRARDSRARSEFIQMTLGVIPGRSARSLCIREGERNERFFVAALLRTKRRLP